MEMTTARPITYIFLGVLFGVIGWAVYHFLGVPGITEGKASESWPQVSGKILSSQVVTSKGSDNQTMYQPEIRFTYEVSGKSYESNQINVSPPVSSGSSGSSYEMVDQFPRGKEVPVYYNPDKPSFAILMTGVPTVARVCYWIGLGVLILGIIIFVQGIFKIVLGGAIIGGALLSKKNNSTQRTRSRERNTNENQRESTSTENEEDGFGIT